MINKKNYLIEIEIKILRKSRKIIPSDDKFNCESIRIE